MARIQTGQNTIAER